MYIIDKTKIIKFIVMLAIVVTSFVGSRGYLQQVANITGRSELPIYSVARDDKKIAISFDTAWGVII